VGGSIQVHVVVADAVLVVLHNLVQVMHARVEDVAVHGEAVGCALTVWQDAATETKQVDTLIGVVVLQNAANLVNHLQVLVPAHIPVVQRVGVRRMSVRKCEVNCDR